MYQYISYVGNGKLLAFYLVTINIRTYAG